MSKLRWRGSTESSVSSPKADSGAPRFGNSTSFYIDAYRSYRSAAESAAGNTNLETVALRAQLFEHRARAKWALALCGEEALPFVLEMLASPEFEERDDARSVLSRMGSDPQIINILIAMLKNETDVEKARCIIEALGAAKSPIAIPTLAAIFRQSKLDECDEVIHAAVLRSLGNLAQRRFDRSDDPDDSVTAWLAENGYETVIRGILTNRQKPSWTQGSTVAVGGELQQTPGALPVWVPAQSSDSSG